jgi:hypothetical protein
MNSESEAAQAEEVTSLVRERTDALAAKLSPEAKTLIARYLDDSYDGTDRPTHADILKLVGPWIDSLSQSSVEASCAVPGAGPVMTADLLSVCRKTEDSESHYLQAVADRLRMLRDAPMSLVTCNIVSVLGPAKCHLEVAGVPTDYYYSSSFPEREARIRLDLDGYDPYLKLWKDVPRSGKRFQFLSCAQTAAMTSHGAGGSIGVQSIRGCARFDLSDLLRGDFHFALQPKTSQEDFVKAQSDWCRQR